MRADASAPRVLILSLSNWFGAARLPKAFRRAGFHVTTLGFPGLLVQRASSIDEGLLVADGATDDELLKAILDGIERSQANVVIPTDDASVIALQAAAATSRRAGAPARLLAVLQDSLGDARHHPTVRSRKALALFASEARLKAPSYATVHSEADALAFAAQGGYPIVLKAEETFAGLGVSICRDAVALRAAVKGLSQDPATLREGVLAQAFVEGRTAMRVVVAFRGRVLGGLSAVKLETWPGPTGPSTVVELIDQPEMSATADAMIQALGFSGFASLDFMLDGAGGAHLIELNPRPTPISHLGERFGSDLCRLLHGAITGAPASLVEPQGLPSKVVLFPQEWVRSPDSPHFAPGIFHDVPWDEPDLVEAYVTIARAQMRYGGFRELHVRQQNLRARLVELERSSSQ